ncbi:hypothetical protein BJ165DRAFT_1525610 [Panaeolus papilionaceus]|nr:hypothetical protein BJ165DRAFT_1525610 [Panaeolus papilionaceus]
MSTKGTEQSSFKSTDMDFKPLISLGSAGQQGSREKIKETLESLLGPYVQSLTFSVQIGGNHSTFRKKQMRAWLDTRERYTFLPYSTEDQNRRWANVNIPADKFGEWLSAARRSIQTKQVPVEPEYKIGQYVILQLEAIVTSIRPLNRSTLIASGIDEATTLSIMEMCVQWHCGMIWAGRGISEDGRLFLTWLSARFIIERYLSADSRFAGWLMLTHLTSFSLGEEADRKREGEHLEALTKELETEELKVISASKVDVTQVSHKVVASKGIEREEEDAKRLERDKEV